MNIDRSKEQTGDALQKLDFCLSCLERENFTNGINWNTDITNRLTLEEVIGALVHAEQELKSIKKDEELFVS
jgi:hypothetical protein